MARLGLASAIVGAALAVAAVRPVAAEPIAGQVYEHPSRHYSVTIPSDARLREPGGTVDIAIDSDKGYGVILQSADAGPETSISEVAATLESAYLGEGKAWEHKIGQDISLVAGLVSYSGTYEGQGARYRVVITKGQINTYTFIFRARSEYFDELEPEFEWMLKNFRPAPGDLPPTPIAPDKSAQPVPAVTEQPVGPTPTTRHFAERRLGYSVDYDPAWILERPTPDAILISGPEGTDAYMASVTIQNVAPPEADSPVQAASRVMDDIRAQFQEKAKDMVFERDGPYIYLKNDVFLLGREFIASFTLNGKKWKQWSLVIPRPDGSVAHYWSYQAPAEEYGRYLPQAEIILRSWTVTPREVASDAEPASPPESLPLHLPK